MVTHFVVNYYILPIDVNAVARQNVVITTFCNVTTFWVATRVVPCRCMTGTLNLDLYDKNNLQINLK